MTTKGALTKRNLSIKQETSEELRSRIMSAVKHANTKPEMTVRSILHNMGFRFRLHRKDLPGSPDIILPKYRTVIFVHGCFWHQHPNCRKATTPKSNTDYWQKKMAENIERDMRKEQELSVLGWHVIVVWQCETILKRLSELKVKFEQIRRHCGED